MKKENITFSQFIESCEELREQYEELLHPFFNAKMIKIWKTMVYSLQMKEYKRDLIWEFLNGDIEKEDLEAKIWIKN